MHAWVARGRLGCRPGANPGVVRFVTRPALALAARPDPPAPYCFKAQCDVRDAGTGLLVGRVMGYDKFTSIQDEVEHACRLQASRLPGEPRCGQARLTMLTAADHRKECSGQVYFVLEGGGSLKISGPRA